MLKFINNLFFKKDLTNHYIPIQGHDLGFTLKSFLNIHYKNDSFSLFLYCSNILITGLISYFTLHFGFNMDSFFAVILSTFISTLTSFLFCVYSFKNKFFYYKFLFYKQNKIKEDLFSIFSVPLFQKDLIMYLINLNNSNINNEALKLSSYIDKITVFFALNQIEEAIDFISNPNEITKIYAAIDTYEERELHRYNTEETCKKITTYKQSIGLLDKATNLQKKETEGELSYDKLL